MSAPILIDGSQGEGGGQVLRTALSLSLVTGRPSRIYNIRARRKYPGLARQHLAAVRAARAVGTAEVEGATLDSTQVDFVPRGIHAGHHRFDVGSAGSATLVLQTVLPPLLTATGPSHLVLEGGTHNPMAPPFDFIARAFLPLVNGMGPQVTARLERPGFFPAGGGQIEITIRPATELAPLSLTERGPVRRRAARALLSRLPRPIAERELQLLKERLGLQAAELRVEEVTGARGPGNAVLVEIECEHVTEVFTAFGQRGVRAEAVAEAVATETNAYLESGAPVGPRLADQLLLPLAVAGGGSFRTSAPTAHFSTNVDVLRTFVDADVRVTPADEQTFLVEVR